MNARASTTAERLSNKLNYPISQMMVRGFSGIKTHFGFILGEGVERLIMWPMIPMLANEARLMIDTGLKS